jgi:hypothetical protein
MQQPPEPVTAWQPIPAPKRTWWHAAYRAAVARTIRGLAAVIVATPQRRRPA